MQQVTSAGECALQKYPYVINGLVNVVVSESEKLSFKQGTHLSFFKMIMKHDAVLQAFNFALKVQRYELIELELVCCQKIISTHLLIKAKQRDYSS